MHIIHDVTNRIIHGDCLDIMRELPAASVDLIVTDPPYLVEYQSRDGRTFAGDDNSRWIKPAYAEMYRVLKPNRFCVSFYGWNKVERFVHAWKDAGFTPVSHLVWVKDYSSKDSFTRAHHECAYVLAKGHPPKPRVLLPDVFEWRYSGNRLHPTQKPVMAITPLIMAFSRIGDIVLDPFCGSGTTAVAAQQFKRRYIGIEKMAQYATVARERLQRTETA